MKKHSHIWMPYYGLLKKKGQARAYKREYWKCFKCGCRKLAKNPWGVKWEREPVTKVISKQSENYNWLAHQIEEHLAEGGRNFENALGTTSWLLKESIKALRSKALDQS